MKIAVCGQSRDTKPDISKLSFQLGELLADAGHLVLTGAGLGYPLEAAKGAFSRRGGVVGVSPAKDEKEHREKYQFHVDCFSQIFYTGLGIPNRNLALVNEAEAIVVVGGQIGTLHEFCVAFAQRKPTAVLVNSGGVSSLIYNIALVCDKEGESQKVFYESSPAEIIKQLHRYSNVEHQMRAYK